MGVLEEDGGLEGSTEVYLYSAEHIWVIKVTFLRNLCPRVNSIPYSLKDSSKTPAWIILSRACSLNFLGCWIQRGKKRWWEAERIGGKWKGEKTRIWVKNWSRIGIKNWSCKQSLLMIYQLDKAKDKTGVREIIGIISHIENTMGLFL